MINGVCPVMNTMALKDLLSIMFMIEHGGVKEIKYDSVEYHKRI